MFRIKNYEKIILTILTIFLLIIIPNIVKAKVSVSSIEITQAPTKTVYKVGEDFDKTGMIVTATYSDGSKNEITDYKIDRGTNLEINQKDVLIYYTEGDREIEAIQPITIIKMEKIEITQAPTKTVYKVGEDFDKTGMIVTATYSDGSKNEITDYKIDRGTNLEINQKDVLIYYTEGDREIEAVQPITVEKKTETIVKEDNTKSTIKIPNAGSICIGAVIIILLIIVIALGVKYINYRKFK